MAHVPGTRRVHHESPVGWVPGGNWVQIAGLKIAGFRVPHSWSTADFNNQPQLDPSGQALMAACHAMAGTCIAPRLLVLIPFVRTTVDLYITYIYHRKLWLRIHQLTGSLHDRAVRWSGGEVCGDLSCACLWVLLLVFKVVFCQYSVEVCQCSHHRATAQLTG